MNCTQCIMIGLSSLLMRFWTEIAEFALLVNSNREKIADDTINKEPTIVPPIQLEQIMYHRAGNSPRDLITVLQKSNTRSGRIV